MRFDTTGYMLDPPPVVLGHISQSTSVAGRGVPWRCMGILVGAKDGTGRRGH